MITHFGTAPFVWVYPIRELADISGLREMKTIKPDFVRGNQPYPPRSAVPLPRLGRQVRTPTAPLKLVLISKEYER